MKLRLYILISVFLYFWLKAFIVYMCINVLLTGKTLYLYFGLLIFANFLVAVGILIAALFNKKLLKRL